MNASVYVVGAIGANGTERLRDELLVNLVREVVIEGTTIDRPTATARNDAHASNSFFTTTGAAARSSEGRTVGRSRRSAGGVRRRSVLF